MNIEPALIPVRADLADVKCPNDYTPCVDATCLKFVHGKVAFLFAKSGCNERENASLFTPTNELSDKCAKALAEKSVDMTIHGSQIEECTLISECSRRPHIHDLFRTRLMIDDVQGVMCGSAG